MYKKAQVDISGLFYGNFLYIKYFINGKGKIFSMFFKPLLKALPSPNIETFSRFVLGNSKNITPRLFSKNLGEIRSSYFAKGKVDEFCSKASSLARTLTEQNDNDFAGIIMSSLSKVERLPIKTSEKIALQGYEIAKANGDYIHMMSRLNDLRKLYYRRPDKLYNYINVLYKQEKCLKHLSKHYDEAIAGYKTVSREAASQYDYTQMLGYVQTEIGKLTKAKHPHDALRKLLSARQIFELSGNKRSLSYIDMLISEIRSTPGFVEK